MKARWSRSASVLLALALLGGGCARRPGSSPSNRFEQRTGRVYFASLDTIGASGNRSWQLPVVQLPPAPAPRQNLRSGLPFEVHVHPRLAQWLRDSSATRVETLLVVFSDSLDIPRFPDYDQSRPPGDSVNLAIRATADSLRDALQASRAPRHAVTQAEIASRGGEVIHSYWLAQMQLITLPLGEVPWLVNSLGASYVQPKRGGETPPDDPPNSATDDDVLAGRTEMSTEPYVPFSPQYGHAGLIDTGVRGDHELLEPTGRLLECWNCVTPTGTCEKLTDWEDTSDGHGTSAAAIFIGGTDRAGTHTGVCEASLNVYKVYETTTADELDAAAAVAALELAADNLDRVVLAEVDGQVTTVPGGVTLSEWNAIAQMADNAYETGSAIIAANGNSGAGKVGAPACARGVIGVGALLITDLVTGVNTRMAGQSYGPMADKRTKPDLQSPYKAETAASGGPADYDNFTGTSGAAPFAAGAAVLLRNWLVQAASEDDGAIDVGQVYAQMIVSGQATPTRSSSGVDQFDEANGAGMMVLPTNGWCWFGKLEIDASYDDAIELVMPGSDARLLEAAIWWEEPSLPDYSTGGVSDLSNLDLKLVSPDDVATESHVESGVFERLTQSAPDGETLGAGTWKLYVTPTSIGEGKVVKVYWTVVYRR